MHTFRDLERKTGLDVFVDMSVSETLYHLIVVGASGGVQQGQHGLDGPQMMAEATALQKRLKVPDKRFWHIKIKVRCGPVRSGTMRCGAVVVVVDSPVDSPVCCCCCCRRCC